MGSIGRVSSIRWALVQMLYLVHSCRSCRMIPMCSQISFAGWVLGQYRATGLLVLPQLLVSQEIFISRWPRVPSNANFCNFLIESLGVSHHAPQCYSPPGLFISLLLIPAMPSLPMKENKKASKQTSKSKNKTNKQTNIISQKRTKTTPEADSSLLLLSCLSITSSVILLALQSSTCHIVYPFVPSA